MAAAVRLIGTGAFGESVIRMLADSFPGARMMEADQLEMAFAEGCPSLVVLALWRPSPHLCESADRLAGSHGVPWMPIIMEHPVLRIGPYVQTNSGPCYRCYQWRRIQHDDQHNATAALHAAYDESADCGPRGYLPHHVRLAAAVATSCLDREILGRVTTIQLGTARVHTHEVVACHGCDRCGAPFVRDSTAMRSALSRRWS